MREIIGTPGGGNVTVEHTNPREHRRLDVDDTFMARKRAEHDAAAFRDGTEQAQAQARQREATERDWRRNETPQLAAETIPTQGLPDFVDGDALITEHRATRPPIDPGALDAARARRAAEDRRRFENS